MNETPSATTQADYDSVSLGRLRFLDGVPCEIKLLGYARVVIGILCIGYSVLVSGYLFFIVVLGAVASAGLALILIPLVVIYFVASLGISIWSLRNGLRLLKVGNPPPQLFGALGICELVSIVFVWPLGVVGIFAYFASRDSKVKEYLSQRSVA